MVALVKMALKKFIINELFTQKWKDSISQLILFGKTIVKTILKLY